MPNDASAAPVRFWRDRRFAVLLALGFAAGVPWPLVAGQVLRQWFTEAGLSLTEIGLLALVGWAYALKFLWAPLLDDLRPPGAARLGRRRGWLLLIQPCLMLAIVVLGLSNPSVSPLTTAALAVLVAFLSASQDIAIDAYRIEILAEHEQGYGLACYGAGYRAALVASGAGCLWLVGSIGWAGAYAYAAALVGIGLVAVLMAPAEAMPEATTPASGWRARMRVAVIDPFADFMRRRYWLAILLFIALFKLGEALAGGMATTFYNRLGFTRVDIANVSTVFGLLATLAGLAAGGVLIARLGMARALVLSGAGQMLSNLMYVALARAGHDLPMLYAQVGIEAFTDGLADAAFLTYLSALTNLRFTATQYALLSSFAVLPLRTFSAASGWLAERLGWEAFFLLTTVAALPAMGIMLWLIRRLPPPVAPPAARPARRPS